MLYIGLLVPYLGLHGHADLEERPLQFSVQHVDVLLHPLKIGNMREEKYEKNTFTSVITVSTPSCSFSNCLN